MAADEARRTTTDGNGEVGDFATTSSCCFQRSQLGCGEGTALSEGLWGRAFLTAYNSASDEERLRMVEGLDKGAGLALLAVPMADASVVWS